MWIVVNGMKTAVWMQMDGCVSDVTENENALMWTGPHVKLCVFKNVSECLFTVHVPGFIENKSDTTANAVINIEPRESSRIQSHRIVATIRKNASE